MILHRIHRLRKRCLRRRPAYTISRHFLQCHSQILKAAAVQHRKQIPSSWQRNRSCLEAFQVNDDGNRVRPIGVVSRCRLSGLRPSGGNQSETSEVRYCHDPNSSWLHRSTPKRDMTRRKFAATCPPHFGLILLLNIPIRFVLSALPHKSNRASFQFPRDPELTGPKNE